jgi:PAS domain S-box-containing protein
LTVLNVAHSVRACTLIFEAPSKSRRRALIRSATQVAIVSGAYVGTAKLGLALAGAQSSITAVWAPTGIALAALLVWGYRLWPAVAIGALLANSWSSLPLVTLLGITTGNTLEALVGASLLLRVAAFQRSLERVKDVLALVVFGGAVSTMVSATIGVASLWLGGAIGPGDLASDWRVWWLGDMGGDLVVTPLLLALASPGALDAVRGRLVEAGALGALLVSISVLVLSRLPYPYPLWPLFIWSALRFRQLGAAASTLIVAGIAVAFTASGAGPFVRGSPDANLLLSQGFMGITSVTALLLAAVTSQRQLAIEFLRRTRDELDVRVWERTSELERSQEELELARELAFLIAEAEDLDDALELALRRICEATGWGMGQAWILSGTGSHLECSPAWHAGSHGLESFRRASERMTFEPGMGLPGRAWADKEPSWIEDVRSDLNFPRASSAAEVGFGAAMAVPVLADDQVAAVMEFFVFGPQAKDKDQVELVATVAAQLGSLIRRKQAEGVIRASEQRFRAVAESATEAIVSANRNGDITYFNSAAEKTFGYSARDVLGKPLTILMPERLRGAHREGLKSFLTTGEGRLIGRTVELPAMRGDGREFPAELSLSTWKQGNEPFFTAMVRDVSGRKHEEKLQEALAREQEAGERLRELDRLKDEFLATVSHELRTPLTVISALTEVLRGSPDHDDRGEWLERVLHNASEMSGMIEQLLDYSRLEAGRVALEVAPLGLRDAALRCIELVEQAIGARQTRVDVPDDLTVQADERGFERILMNLLTNAAKYSPEGSAIRVTATAENGEAVIAVQDEGTGIPPPEQARVFERFYQGSVVSEKRGAGIGLSIVRRYVELLGGRVWVESKSGRGSTFVFTMPLTTPLPAARERTAA